MRQKFPESLVEIGPGLLARRVESHSPLVEDDRATTDLQYARNMMRGQNHKIAFPAVSLEKFFEQINAAAIEHSVGFVEQQQSRFEQIPFGYREAALHPAGQCRYEFVGSVAEIHRCERRTDITGIVFPAIQRGEKLQVFTHGKIFIKVGGRRKEADLSSRRSIGA